MTSTAVGIVGIVVLVLVLLSRMPIAFAMALLGFLGFSYLVSVGAGLSLLAQNTFATLASYSMSIIPLFVLMGQIAFNSGMGQRLYYTAYRWLGHMPGGLAIATIGGCAGFAAISGSSPATAATIGAISLPEMRGYNYDPALATGSIAAGGTLGILIPPSIMLIIYGILTEQSITKLFYAGILPGILLAGLFMVTIYVMCRRNPHLGPPAPPVSFKAKLASLSGTVEMLTLFLLLMVGLFVGWFTPTEAGGVGALGALLIALSRRKLSWQGLRVSLMETVQTTAMLLLILVGAFIFGRFLAVSKVPFVLADWASGLPLPPFGILAVVILLYMLGGCVMDVFSLVVLTIPIFFPLAVSLGFDPIWFGVMIVMVCEMGLITPPVGINVYVIAGVAKDIPVNVIFKGIVPFFLAMVVWVIIMIAFPQIALFLPSLIK